MSVSVNKIVVFGVMALVAAVISLPVVASAVVAPPVVTVQSPLIQGLRAPVKIALDATGNIYIADQRAGGIVKLDAYGVQQSVIAAATPSGLAFAQDGALLVCQGDSVVRYNTATGQEVGRLAGGSLKAAAGVAVDDVTGFIYVVDSRASQIEVYTASGQFVKSFAAGLLVSPTGIAFEKVSRQVVVADTYGNKIQFFDVNGVFVKSIGDVIPGGANSFYSYPLSPLHFPAPVAIAFEYSKDPTPVLNRMYVVDMYQGNVKAIDAAGAVLSSIVTPATVSGQLMVPSDAVFDSVNNRLLVVNGVGNVTIFGVDGGRNPSDVTPPQFTINQLPAEVVVNNVMVGGTVEVGATIQIVAAGSVVVGPVTYSGASWNAQLSSLTVGVNSVNVTAKDASGNVAPSQSAIVTYVLPAPGVTIAPLSSVTRYAALTVTGTVDAGSVVKVTNQATSVVKDATVVGTAWSCDIVLADGINNLRVSAQKPQSAISIASSTVALDVVAPTLSVSALANGSNASDPVQNISGTVADLNMTSVTVNGVVAVLNGNAFSVPVTLVNGSNPISVVAADAAGNTTVDSRTLNYNAGSGLVVLAPVDNSITAIAKQEISGTVNGALTVTVAGIPVAVTDNKWSVSVDLVSGLNTISIVATDVAGNTSSSKRSITFDASKPDLAVLIPAQDIAVNVPNVLVSGTVSDTTELIVEYSVNGVVSVVPVTSGVYSFNVNFAAAGNYPVVVTARDAAGNTSTVVRNIIYDNTPPVLTLNPVAGVMPTKLSGSVEAGSSVVVKDGVRQIGSAVIANGMWSADLAGVVYDSLLVVATDAAGNSTSKSLVYNFPDGTLNGTAKPSVQDALRAIRIVVNQLDPTAQELAHYDIGPLVNGKPNPNGKIEIVDAILILRKALGLKSW